MKSFVTSRKVLLGFVAVIMALLGGINGMDQELLINIEIALMILVGAIAIDGDFAGASMTVFEKLIQSRKFWITLIAIILFVLEHYLNVMEGTLQMIAYILEFFVGAIGVADWRNKTSK